MDIFNKIFDKPWLRYLLLIGLLTTSITIIKQRNTIEDLTFHLSNTRGQLEESENKIFVIQSNIGNLESSISELRSEVENFDYENWRYVVPNVEDATSNVVSAYSDLVSVVY